MALKGLVQARDVSALKQYIRDKDLQVKDGKIIPRDEATKMSLLEQAAFWNQRQQARKILLG